MKNLKVFNSYEILFIFHKKLCNDWQTEKMRKLKFNDQMANKKVIAKWFHLIEIYKFENDSVSVNLLN